MSMPSIVPVPPEDYYVVLNHYGELGPAFAETDLYRADYETTISDLMSGQHADPLRVIMFNPEVNRSTQSDLDGAAVSTSCNSEEPSATRMSWLA